MRVELKSLDGSNVKIEAFTSDGFVFIADDKELLTISLDGEVKVNGESAEPELIGLALIQWARVIKELKVDGKGK
ncbi:MAG: hypothetical protein HEP71_34245 [Roseivirga sp.]|nr:hypothetical protein [Roseivirga sp.]